MPRNKTTHELAKELLSKPDIPVEVSVNAENIQTYASIAIFLLIL